MAHRLIDGEGRTGRAIAAAPPVYHILRRNNVYHHTATVPSPAGGTSQMDWAIGAVSGGKLRFGVAMETVSGTPPQGRFEVAIAAHVGGGARREIFRQSIDGTELAGAVELRQIDLPELAGGSVLRFTTASMSGADPGALRIHWIDPIVLTSEPAPPNVLVVMVDTLRADRLNAFGGEHGTMPALDARLANAAVFSNAFANANWTLPSVASLMTGMFPGQHHAGRRTLLGASTVQTDYEARPVTGGFTLTIGSQRFRFQMLHPSMTTLGSRFAARGYYTAAIHENGYLNHPSGVLRGMQYVHEEGSQNAETSTNTAIEWLRARKDDRFFLFLHYIDPHQYILKFDAALMGAAPESVGAADRARVLAAYDDLVRATDTQLARFFQEFDALGLDDNTYVVFVSDHGEQFFKRGVVGAHGGLFDASVLHVPLAIWGPGISPRTVRDRVSLADVAPTLLELLEVPADGATRFSGDSLVPLLHGRPLPEREIISEFPLWVQPGMEDIAAVRGDFMLIHRPGSTPPVDKLYRLPNDVADVAAAHSDTTRAMRERVVRYLDASRAAFDRLSYADVPVDPETLRSLRALGYIR